MLIYQNCPHLEAFEGEIEGDESYFGGAHKGSRGTTGKVALFGLLKRNGKAYTEDIPNTRSIILPIIREQIKLDRLVHTDTYYAVMM
ncbi:hypothetical protein BKK50_03615 [Rodentibacter rarus]|uniref:ISXO2-like transposase domain-containing protein n=1 Tax=Rodentibacter rarus TaxID=1908260 RepID=A0A1V3IPF5_9PAST|nr:hypothetical protein BKK50_03615 [Rodentibacter rarus]